QLTRNNVKTTGNQNLDKRKRGNIENSHQFPLLYLEIYTQLFEKQVEYLTTRGKTQNQSKTYILTQTMNPKKKKEKEKSLRKKKSVLQYSTSEKIFSNKTIDFSCELHLVAISSSPLEECFGTHQTLKLLSKLPLYNKNPPPTLFGDACKHLTGPSWPLITPTLQTLP
ncbi:hypothetical protein PanWU01x14_052010, partial [Parasponia andersonii]